MRLPESIGGDPAETAWDCHYAGCRACQAVTEDRPLEELLPKLCPVGEALAKAAIWARTVKWATAPGTA